MRNKNRYLANIATAIIALNVLGLVIDKYKVLVAAGAFGAGFIGYRLAYFAEHYGDCEFEDDGLDY